MKEIKILELFGGIGAIRKAFERLNIPHKVVDYVEIDKYAVKSYNAMFNENFECQDITEWDKNIEVDFIMHGSPCQDFSVAGKQAGGDLGSGTRSSLMYETIRIVGKLRPKYVMWENVKNLLSKKHKHNFDAYIETMNILGYNSYYQVLNAKNYGIPQNRERVYTISIRKDIDNNNFVFPEKEELKLRLKDMLENKVDEKYYLSEEVASKYVQSKENNTNVIGNLVMDKWQDSMKRIYDIEKYSPAINTMQGGNLEPKILEDSKCIQVGQLDSTYDQSGRIYAPEGISPTIMSNSHIGGYTVHKILVKNATKKGYDEAIDGDSIKLAYPNSKTRRGRVGHQVLQTIMAKGEMGVVEKDLGYRIRKLTPKECWRLMGFDDEDFYKAEKVNSNTQLYKQAGNSIVVNVLEKILLNLFKEE